jgi:phosphoribosylglycinamide formyltransferase 2
MNFESVHCTLFLFINKMKKRILLLGSGELGKELTISLQRLGQYVIAVDSYQDAPAMQVAQEHEVINMLNGNELDLLVDKHKPDIIIPEIEAIRTEYLYKYEQTGIVVVPSAKAVNYTMNRKAIRDLAAKELGIRTAPYLYASDFSSFQDAINQIGMPCVVKPLMSSSGKGQSIIRQNDDIESAWKYAMEGSRGDLMEVIVEGFVNFDYEITLLTVTQQNGNTLFCPPIGHRQERGDYQESWQPILMNPEHLLEAQQMAKRVTEALTGNGIWGVEFFITQQGAYFSELSPRPHDTGMVTLAGTQNLSEFELHARAVLALPINEIKLEKNGASAVILANEEKLSHPIISGIEDALTQTGSDVRIFGKPSARKYRRMGVVLTSGNEDVSELVESAKRMARKIKVE